RIMAVAGTCVGLVGYVTGTPTQVFYNTEEAILSNMLAYPFASCVHVPRCYARPIRWRHKRYPGYHELAYLHPDYFTPDPGVLDKVGLKEGDVFSVVRFVSWTAAHDICRHGFSAEGKLLAVKRLSEFGPVFVSCEGPLPESLEYYRLDLEVSRMHDLMSYAALIFGESGTMSSEGAVLGVPAVFVDLVGRDIRTNKNDATAS
ncbi:MAG: hypothetical protein KGZ25_10550, partial [Planctomycetes bacterium]|nr:hypothetical protein [Planctomycetota bacterium]